LQKALNLLSDFGLSILVRLSRKGIEKATAELGLSFLAYNLKRAINMVGTEKLLVAIRA